MNPISHAFDSRAMPLLSEPSTAPSAFSLWDWLGHRVASRGPLRQPAQATTHDLTPASSLDARRAGELRAAADLHELRHGR